MNHINDRDNAILWARDLMSRKNWLILDTETTALKDAEICQVGILSPDGHVLLDALVKPTRPIPIEATDIHGITDDMVEGALKDIYVLWLIEFLSLDKEIVIYNCQYDRNVILNVSQLYSERTGHSSPTVTWQGFREWTCAMLFYSAFVGEVGKYGNDWKWQKLPGARAHSAIEDCRATLNVIKFMADSNLSTEEPCEAEVAQ